MGTRTYSLVEQKKQQWAKEREEMIGLCGIWGGLANRRFEDHKPSIRTHFVSSCDLRRPEVSSENFESPLGSSDRLSRRRSPSLPPIYKHYQDGDGDGEEGETSGYASDSGERQEYQPSWPNKPRSRQNSTWNSSNCLNTPDSLNSDGGRPRWGDKGVGVGHLWDASIHNPDARLPAVTDRPGATPPAWLCRATNNTVSEVLVITHPEVSSPVTEYGSCDTLANSDRTYLRGQNISIEPEELMERERKRQKAKELQNAIRQQLEERERKRKEERERRQREERLEEERLRKQQEIERKRLEDERQKQREKEVKEERKEKAMREAIETAERLAREEKIKTRKKYKQEVSEPQLPVYEERTNDAPCVVSSELKIARVEIEQPKLLNMQENQAKQQIKEEEVDISKEQSAPTILQQTSPQNQEKEMKSLIKNDDSQQKEIVKPHIMNVKKENSTESSDDQDVDPDSLDEEVSPEIALVLSEPHEVEVNQLSLVVSPGRLLTPSKFRTNPSYEKSTQTDLIKSEKLPLRCRSQPRLEERPKWGVNRPETQYIKQSERDPYYQTRLRRNLMRVRSKSNKPEREDSRSPSPVNMKVQGNQAPVTTVSRGTITPRVMQMVLPSHNPLRASRPRYLSFKGGVGAVMASNVFRQKPEPRPQQPPAEITLVSDVLNQLTSLRKGLTMKQQEWDVSRSQTPFSEVSSLSTSA